MCSIDLYNNSEIILSKKESNIYKIFILVVLIFLIGAGLLITLYKYDSTISLKGIIKDNKICLTVLEDNLKLLSNNSVLINEEIYKTIIYSISDPIYDSNYNTYYEVYLNIDLDEDILIKNNVIDINILLGKKTLYEKIKEKVEEGLQL